MKHFPILRAARFTLQLKELSFSAAIAVASIPDHLFEAETTLFLQHAIAEVSQGIADPLDWTVQERMLAVSSYLCSVSDDGPNFAVSGVENSAKYFDYVDMQNDYKLDSVFAGEIGGDQWHLAQLTGRMAESIERLEGEIEGIEPRLHWQLGAMAAQLHIENELPPVFETDGQYDEWLLGKMRVFFEYPETEFNQLIHAYYLGMAQLKHLFSIKFSDDGIVAEQTSEAVGDLPPARFPTSTCLTPFALAMAGKPDRNGSKP